MSDVARPTTRVMPKSPSRRGELRHQSIRHLERRAVLGPGAAVIVDARGADIRMAKPLLHLGDVGLMVERVGGGGRAQRMRADLETEMDPGNWTGS
jgi:hypothetical protein